MDPATVAAVACSLALFSALASWIALARRGSHLTLWQSALLLVNTFFTRVLWRAERCQRLPIADDQGAVIVCNHGSGVDPLLTQLCTDRIVHWMVAREYFEGFGISIVFRSLKSIPVNRGGIDTAATKAAIRLAQQGELVGVFPEGRVNTTKDVLLPGRPGAALIALKARVNVIPCYVQGVPYDGTALGSFLMSGRARVTVGQVIELSEYFGREGEREVLQELTKKFLVEIARLAGAVNFTPKCAGRNWMPGRETSGGAGHPEQTKHRDESRSL